MRALATAALVSSTPLLALAQASCSSDGLPQPTALFERFISADCEACWADPAAPAPSATTTVVLDWIVPSAQGDDAPLSAAATSDAVQRLQALGRPAPAGTDVALSPVQPPARPLRLRVANGPPINDYLGTGIALARAPAATPPTQDWQYHLLLVETVPAGSEGTAVTRNLVRNLLSGTWNQRNQLSKKEQIQWMDNRPMRIPTGAQPQRLHMVGWVQDAKGRVLAAAQSVCR